MQRDLIIITGNQGFGKSVWAKSFCRSLSRLLVFDPMGSYAGVDFITDPDEWAESVAEARLNAFRYGRIFSDDLPLIGNAAYSAGNCTLVIEECALLFRRGQELDEWSKRLIFTGRHQRVNVLLIAQRAAKIPIDIRSQATRVISFRQTEPDDIDAISERFGNRYSDELQTELNSLSERECYDWENGAVKRYIVPV